MKILVLRNLINVRHLIAAKVLLKNQVLAICQYSPACPNCYVWDTEAFKQLISRADAWQQCRTAWILRAANLGNGSLFQTLFPFPILQLTRRLNAFLQTLIWLEKSRRQWKGFEAKYPRCQSSSKYRGIVKQFACLRSGFTFQQARLCILPLAVGWFRQSVDSSRSSKLVEGLPWHLQHRLGALSLPYKSASQILKRSLGAPASRKWASSASPPPVGPNCLASISAAPFEPWPTTKTSSLMSLSPSKGQMLTSFGNPGNTHLYGGDSWSSKLLCQQVSGFQLLIRYLPGASKIVQPCIRIAVFHDQTF